MSIPVVAAFALVGWFAGSAIWSVARNQAFARSPFGSAPCELCDAPLPARSWFPGFAFGTLRTCPSCEAARPRSRALFELAVAGYYAIAAWQLDERRHLASVLVFSAILLVILLVDRWLRIVFVSDLVAGFVAATLFAALEGRDALLDAGVALVIAVAVAAFLLGLAALLYKGLKTSPIGLPDLYLAGVVGAMAGTDDVVRVFFIAIMLAAAASIYTLVRRESNRRRVIAYGPWLIAGALVAFAWQ